jgi:hypothetical protein
MRSAQAVLQAGRVAGGLAKLVMTQRRQRVRLQASASTRRRAAQLQQLTFTCHALLGTVPLF